MSRSIRVTTAAELSTALASARAGDTIRLAPGEYGTFTPGKWGQTVTFPDGVTITSANPDRPAVFTGMRMHSVENLTIEGVVFDYRFKAGDAIWGAPFTVFESRNITFRDNLFDGDVARGVSADDDGYGFGIGLTIRDSRDVTVTGNEFRAFFRGATFGNNTGLTVTGNDVHSIRSDGFNFAAVQGALIEGNHFHDFRLSRSSNDHPDMIQVWTEGTTRPTTDITIRGNILDIGAGGATQSIFMRNELVDTGRAGAEMFYRNVLIENNVIFNGHLHGINVGEAAGVTIRNNTVLRADGDRAPGAVQTVEVPRIAVAGSSTGVTITGNVTGSIGGFTGQKGWTVTGNVIAQDTDPLRPGHYDSLFVTSTRDAGPFWAQFIGRPGGAIAEAGAGAPITRGGAVDPIDGIAVAFDMGTDAENRLARSFDAGPSRIDGSAPPRGTVFEWSFGDGTTVTGRKPVHVYDKGGIYEVALTLRLPDGRIDTERFAITVHDPEVLRIAGGTVTRFAAGEAVTIGSVAKTGLALGAPGVALAVDRAHVQDMLSAAEVKMDLVLSAASPASAGEILRLHGTMVLSVTARGEVSLQANAADGTAVRLVSTGVKVTDGASHTVSIVLDDGMLGLVVNGARVAEAAFAGTFANLAGHNLTFGNPWNGANFAGTLHRFDLGLEADGAPEPPPPAAPPPVLDAGFVVTPTHASRYERIFDASATQFGDQGLPEGTAFIWSFGDGTTATGPRVLHRYADGGDYMVRLTVRLPDGTADTERAPVTVQDATLLQIADGAVTRFAGEDGIRIGTVDPDGLVIGPTGTALQVGRVHVADILGGDDVYMAFDLTAAGPRSKGAVALLHQTFALDVTARGEVMLRFFGAAGTEARLVSTGVSITDGARHRIEAVLDDGRAELRIDGQVVAARAFNDVLADVGRHNLMFGSPWNANFTGTLHRFELSLEDEMPPVTVALAPAGGGDAFVFAAGLAAHPLIGDDGPLTAADGGGHDAGPGADWTPGWGDGHGADMAAMTAGADAFLF